MTRTPSAADSLLSSCRHVQLNKDGAAGFQGQPLKTSKLTNHRQRGSGSDDTQIGNERHEFKKKRRKRRQENSQQKFVKLKIFYMWRSTADGALVRIDGTFCAAWPDAGRRCSLSEWLASIFFPSLRGKLQISNQQHRRPTLTTSFTCALLVAVQHGFNGPSSVSDGVKILFVSNRNCLKKKK